MKEIKNYSPFEQIQTDLGHGLVNSVMNISLLDNFVWVKNPKVASSTLDKTLQAVSARNLGAVTHRPHSPIQHSVFIKPYQLAVPFIDEILNSDQYYRFTFVRDPYKRVFSAYIDKIVGNTKNKTQILRYSGEDTSDLTKEISFEQFVLALSEIDPTKMDRHWMPQNLITGAQYIDYAFIGKIEKFNSDIEKVFQSLQMEIDDYYSYYAPHKNSSGVHIEDYLADQATLDLINRIYETDFSLFDYEMRTDIRQFDTLKESVNLSV